MGMLFLVDSAVNVGWILVALSLRKKKRFEVSILPVWSDQDIRNLQKADRAVMEWLESGITPQQCSQNSTWQLKSLWTQKGNLDVKDGILYRQWEDILGGGKNKRLQLTLPAAQVPEVLRSLHDSCIAGHLRTKKTLEKVRVRFYWPGQKEGSG